MNINTSLSAYPEFVEELDAFNRFSEAYFERGERVRVRRRDPDVERLIEALAFFAAQTRIAAARNVRGEFHGLFHTYLDFLLHPLPAMGLLRALPRPELVEGTTIPRGTEFEITPAGGLSGSFRSIAGLDLFPLARTTGHYLEDERRFVLRFESLRGRRVGSPASLALFINRVDLSSSIALYDLLRGHLKAVSLRYDRGEEGQPGIPCQASFGRRRSLDERVAYDPGHPVWSKNIFVVQYQYLNIYCICHNSFVSRLDRSLQLADYWPAVERIMYWVRILAYITGTVDQELLRCWPWRANARAGSPR